MNVYLIFCNVVGVDENIVEVRSAKDVKEGAQYVVDEMLQSGGSVRKSKGHNQRLKQTSMCTEFRFPNIIVSYANQVVGASNIQCGINFSFGQLVKRFAY